MNPVDAISDQSKIRFGCAVGGSYWKDSNCIRLIKENCSVVVNENAFKWGLMEEHEGKVNWTGVDELVSFAEENNALIKLHNLFWPDQQQPWWINDELTSDQLECAMLNRIAYTAEKFKDREYLLYGIDVVNEAVDDRTGELKDCVYLRKLGADWVIKVFTWTREIFGDKVSLIYNDYNMEEGKVKNKGVLKLVEQLNGKKLIDEVGFQMHQVFKIVDPDKLKEIFKDYVDMGLMLNYSELDIRMKQGVELSDEALENQGDYAYSLCRTLVQTGSARSIMTWGITDKYTWIKPPTFPTDAPLPFDVEYNPKPFAKGIKKALNVTLI